jgi:glycosyltransferase involved in cell wall biosynthesis
VLSQTYDRYEIIIVDDGSTDNGISKVERLNNTSIKIFRQENKGVSIARNVGVENSKYDYVVFLDADDVWLEGLLCELNILANKYPNAGILGVNNYFEYANGKTIYEKYDGLFGNQKSGLIRDYLEVFSKYSKSPFCNSGCCYPKQIFNEMGGYKEGIRLTEDSDLWCRIAFKYDIAYSSEPLITYYMQTEGNTHQVFEPKDFEVSVTLKTALRCNCINPNFVESVKRLVAFQQLNLVKRAIVAGFRLFAMRKLIDKNLFCHYPFKTSYLLIISIFPTKVVQTIKQLIVRQ